MKQALYNTLKQRFLKRRMKEVNAIRRANYLMLRVNALTDNEIERVINRYGGKVIKEEVKKVVINQEWTGSCWKWEVIRV